MSLDGLVDGGKQKPKSLVCKSCSKTISIRKEKIRIKIRVKCKKKKCEYQSIKYKRINKEHFDALNTNCQKCGSKATTEYICECGGIFNFERKTKKKNRKTKKKRQKTLF